MIVYRELASLERDLGIPAQRLYAVSNQLSRHYHSVTIPKRGGGERQLSVPDHTLKFIQQRITEVLLVHMPISSYATAYRCGGSTVRHALPHVEQPQLLQLDIHDFFGSVLYSAVKDKAFPTEIYAENLRVLLTMLCYHQDALPQGAPSSPAISNILLRDFDERVGRWSKIKHVAYTRYCDDMSFSGVFDAKEVRRFVQQELRREGYFLNERKTHLTYPGQRQIVTGIVVNHGLSIPADYRRALRQELYFCQKYGVPEHLAHLNLPYSEQEYLQKLLGRVNYVLSVMPNNKEIKQHRDWLQNKLKLIGSTT